MNGNRFLERWKSSIRPPWPVGSRRPQAEYHRLNGRTPGPAPAATTLFAGILRHAFDKKWLEQSTPAQQEAAADFRDAFRTALRDLRGFDGD